MKNGVEIGDVLKYNNGSGANDDYIGKYYVVVSIDSSMGFYSLVRYNSATTIQIRFEEPDHKKMEFKFNIINEFPSEFSYKTLLKFEQKAGEKRTEIVKELYSYIKFFSKKIKDYNIR
jgi:hypothetical protein